MISARSQTWEFSNGPAETSAPNYRGQEVLMGTAPITSEAAVGLLQVWVFSFHGKGQGLDSGWRSGFL